MYPMYVYTHARVLLCQAWNDLYHMGYRSDLTAGMGYGDEVYNLAPPASNDAQRRAVLPELTKKALMW